MLRIDKTLVLWMLFSLIVTAAIVGNPAFAQDPSMIPRPDTTAARLGGFPGIKAFLETRAVPAILADPVTSPFFAHLTESADDIDTCLALLLDHDLGGSSMHNGAVLADGHQCRSSMSNIHRGLGIDNQVIDRFISIVGAEATRAGVQSQDVAAVAKVLERYRGGVRESSGKGGSLSSAMTSSLAATSSSSNSGGDLSLAPDSVAAHLGGFLGIRTFLEVKAVPAILADPLTGPFFAHLTEAPGDIETCLAMLLDHDLGGSSAHNGAVLASGHQCRSSMSNIHRGLGISDQVVTRFITIVGEQAAKVGVQQADINAVAKVLDRYRGGVRNK